MPLAASWLGKQMGVPGTCILQWPRILSDLNLVIGPCYKMVLRRAAGGWQVVTANAEAGTILGPWNWSSSFPLEKKIIGNGREYINTRPHDMWEGNLLGSKSHKVVERVWEERNC